MSNTKTLTPVVSVNASQLRDDVMETALANGFTQQDVERLERQIAYRKSYSKRPDVIAKRREYSAKRYAKMKVLSQLLKGGV